jgi:uncharacterized membrane protein YhfC
VISQLSIAAAMITVPQLSIAAMVITLAVSSLVPLGCFIFIRRRYGAEVKPLLFGMLGFAVFLILIALLSRFAIQSPIGNAVFASLMAGVIIESVRYAILFYLSTRYNQTRFALAYGTGQTMAEALFSYASISGMFLFISVYNNTGRLDELGLAAGETMMRSLSETIGDLVLLPSGTFLLGGINTFFLLAVNLSLSYLMFIAVMHKKPVLLPAAMLVRTFYNLPDALYAEKQITFAVLIFVNLILAGVIVLAALGLKKTLSERSKTEESILGD